MRIFSKILGRYVQNVRHGFATNSSSSHSLVYFKEPVASNSTSYSEGPEYGWERFTLDTLGEKLMYLLVRTIGQGYWGTDRAEIQDRAAEYYQEYGALFPEFSIGDFEEALTGYVDHASSDLVDMSDIDLVRDPHVVIYGGNDNDESFLDEIIASRKSDIEWVSETSGHQQTPDEYNKYWGVFYDE